jgi:hypothetical protein
MDGLYVTPFETLCPDFSLLKCLPATNKRRFDY